FEVSQLLAVAAGTRPYPAQLGDVVARGAGEESDIRQARRQSGNRDWRSRSVAGDHDIAGRYKKIERRPGTDAARRITANRKFVAEEEPFVNRNARDESQRLRISDFGGSREGSNCSSLQT